MRRASHFFHRFTRKKGFFITGSYERIIACLVFSFSFKCVCVIQHFFRPRLSTALNAHGTKMPVPAGCVHAGILTKPSRVGAVVSRSELLELGAATCVGTWLGRVFFTFLLYRHETRNSTSTRVPVHSSNARAVSETHAAGDIVSPTPY